MFLSISLSMSLGISTSFTLCMQCKHNLKTPSVSHFKPFCYKLLGETMFLIMSTRNSNRIGGKGTRENRWGNRSQDQEWREQWQWRGMSVKAYCALRLHNLCDISQTKLSSTPFLEKHWRFMCKGKKNKFINLSILNTWVFICH